MSDYYYSDDGLKDGDVELIHKLRDTLVTSLNTRGIRAGSMTQNQLLKLWIVMDGREIEVTAKIIGDHEPIETIVDLIKASGASWQEF